MAREKELSFATSHDQVERILAADPWLARLTADDSPLGIMVELTQRESVSQGAKDASANCAAHWRDLRRQLALRSLPSGDGRRLHAEVLRVLEKLIPDDPAPDSTEGQILVALAGAVESYEKSSARSEIAPTANIADSGKHEVPPLAINGASPSSIAAPGPLTRTADDLNEWQVRDLSYKAPEQRDETLQFYLQQWFDLVKQHEWERQQPPLSAIGEHTRDAIIEECAKEAERLTRVPHGDGTHSEAFTHYGNQQVARAIRGLKSGSATDGRSP